MDCSVAGIKDEEQRSKPGLGEATAHGRCPVLSSAHAHTTMNAGDIGGAVGAVVNSRGTGTVHGAPS